MNVYCVDCWRLLANEIELRLNEPPAIIEVVGATFSDGYINIILSEDSNAS